MEFLSLFFPLILAFFIIIFGGKIFAYFLNVLNDCIYEFIHKKGDFLNETYYYCCFCFTYL